MRLLTPVGTIFGTNAVGNSVYIPSHFEVTDGDEIIAFLKANAFGQLVSLVNGKLFATHLPFLLSDDCTRLLGHLALQNPQHKELGGQDVLVTFEGPHDYISPAWYNSPGVPTWNYQAVHVTGRCRVFTDASELETLVNALTQHYEARFDQPWQPQYQASMLGAIVGIDVEIHALQCKYKLSQNRSAQDRKQVISQLDQHGSSRLAQAMQEVLD